MGEREGGREKGKKRGGEKVRGEGGRETGREGGRNGGERSYHLLSIFYLPGASYMLPDLKPCNNLPKGMILLHPLHRGSK